MELKLFKGANEDNLNQVYKLFEDMHIKFGSKEWDKFEIAVAPLEVKVERVKSQ